MIMNFWKTYILVTTLIVLTVGGSEDDPELKERVVKVKAAMCASPLPADKIDRLFECDMLVSLAVS